MTTGISTTTTGILAFVLISLFHVSAESLNETDTSDSTTESPLPTWEFPVNINIISNIGKPGVLLFNLASEDVFKVKYSVNCSSRNTVYSIVATTSAKNVADIKSVPEYNISCAEAGFENGTRDNEDSLDAIKIDETQNEEPVVSFYVEGEFNMTVTATMIGRSFLLLLARKINPTSNSDQISNVHSASFQPDDLPGNISNGSNDVSYTLDTFQNSSMLGTSPTVVGKAMIIVVQLPRPIDSVFRVVLYIVIILATIGMGVKVDFVVIKNVLRRPTGPIIGIACQYICMPLISYAVARLVPQESPAISLGIFACGIAPGGGPSNMFTFLLGGDLSLSVTMTTVSSIAALGLLPLWLFTLGDNFKDDTVSMHVPYEKILEALAVAILPLFVGMLIKYKAPRVSQIISKILKPVLIVVVAFTLSLGIYTNFYIFKMISPMTIFAGCLLPYVGYLVGTLVSFFCFRSWTHIKTIAIETGIQNTGVAFLILFLSLPPPDNQLASVAPASSVIMTPLPLFIAVFIYTLYNRCTKKRQADKDKSLDTKLENGDKPSEKSEAGVHTSPEEELALIIRLWHKINGTQPKRQEANGTATTKELATMLPEKEKMAIN